MIKLKKNNYKFWHSPIALIVLFCLLILFGYKIIDLILKERETAHKKELIRDDIENLRQRESSLSGDILKLKTEEGQEEIIREKYQVAKPNEKIVIIIDEKNKSDSLPEGENNSYGFVEWLKNIFKK